MRQFLTAATEVIISSLLSISTTIVAQRKSKTVTMGIQSAVYLALSENKVTIQTVCGDN
ncbi:MAG: hypothetical protein ACREPR_21175 [Brasilonema sp.]